jgi:hypothetical protein
VVKKHDGDSEMEGGIGEIEREKKGTGASTSEGLN